jgi:hypothetical protein
MDPFDAQGIKTFKDLLMDPREDLRTAPCMLMDPCLFAIQSQPNLKACDRTIYL